MIIICNYDRGNHTIFLIMQWNCTSPILQNQGYDPFSINKAPSYPQIIGEGDVTSLIFPDGSIQLYFVPTNRHVALAPFHLNTNFPNHCTVNKDIWFVRSISHPLPPVDSLLNRPFPNVYGDQQALPQYNPNFCINSPPRADFYQKFHNDDSTSTTDIHYFYPSLRYNSHLKYSAEIQTEPLPFNTNAVGGCQGHCGCKSAETVKKILNNSDASASSTSYMSVDSASNSKHKVTKRNKKKSKFKTNKSRDYDLKFKKSEYKYNKSKDHSSDYDLETKKYRYKTNKGGESNCECNLETKKTTSDKLVTTFADRATGSIVKGGRHTQTDNKKSKRSDIKTELWMPIDCNSSSTLKLVTCDNCSGQCRCSSTETDD